MKQGTGDILHHSDQPLVSVIIPCYNHGKYLSTAIKSVLSQTCQQFELIVVDDGSVDNTKQVCLGYPSVKYIYQINAGLSAARNTGLKHSTGQFLVFLDADDWLFTEGLEINLSYFKQNAAAGFVSGAHEIFYEPENKTWVIQQEVSGDHYTKLLTGNFIGMHATVMYQRWAFDNFSFDTSLKYCEDYDLYLKISRQFPVIHHTQLIAVYRFHDLNMSSNYVGMMKYAILVLSAQKKFLTSDAEKASFNKGMVFWKSYYTEKIYNHLLSQLYNGTTNFDSEELITLKNDPQLYAQFKTVSKEVLRLRLRAKMKHNIKKIIFMGTLRKMYSKIKKRGIDCLPGEINLGDLNRTTPFSTQFGYDRGGPVDRYYIENFLQENSGVIQGRVLEIGDNEYSLRYGGSKIIRSDILHIDERNEKATYIGDLSNAPQLPSDSFDCIVLTQTLHLIYNYQDAIKTCYRVLKRGGTLLLTVPGISHIAQDEWGKYWLWAFTAASMQKIMEESFNANNIRIKTNGNVLVATAFLYGMGRPELNKEQLDVTDPHYQVIISVSATK